MHRCQEGAYSFVGCLEEAAAARVGCRLQGEHLCTSEQQYRLLKSSRVTPFRSYHNFYKDLFNAENSGGISELSGCLAPCDYRRYGQVAALTKYSTYGEDTCFISVWVASSNTRVEAEVFLYPWTSLVAEFGGTAGLFLGLSFMSLWDGVKILLGAIARIKL